MKGKEIFKKLRAPIGASSQSKSKCQTVKDVAMTKSQQMRFEFVWKHWSGRRFKQKKAKHAGWGRVCDATYNSKGNGTYTKLACSHFSRLGPIYMSNHKLYKVVFILGRPFNRLIIRLRDFVCMRWPSLTVIKYRDRAGF